MSENLQQPDQVAPESVYPLGPATWVAVALVLAEVVFCCWLGLSPTSLPAILERLPGCSTGLLLIVIWGAVMIWRLWRDRRGAIWRTFRCGVIVAAIGIPAAFTMHKVVNIAAKADPIQISKLTLYLTADVPEIRQWAGEYKPRDGDRAMNNEDIVVAPQNLPPCIRRLAAGAQVNRYAKEVRITKGNDTTGHWGLIVTPTNAWTYGPHHYSDTPAQTTGR